MRTYLLACALLAVSGPVLAANPVFQVNGTPLANQTTVNLQNSDATNGLTLQFSNPSLGNVKLGLSGFPPLVSGECLTNNGTTLSWGTCGSGSGTVTSVGLTMPAWLAVAGSPVTSSGTLAVTAATGQAQNEFLATPNGSSGAVGLRAITSADLPSTIAASTTGNAATATALQALPAGCPAGEYANGYSDATLDMNCGTPSGSGTVNPGTSGQLAYYPASGSAVSGLNSTGTGNAMLASGPTFTLPNYTTAGEPACSSDNKGQPIWLTDGAGALATCNGTTWMTAGTTQFTYTGTGCTPSAASGSVAAGTITLAAGPCTSVTITPNGVVGMQANTGWTCSVGDRTAQNAGTWIPKWGESVTTQTTVTLPIPGAAGTTDVITFSCIPY